MDLQLLKIPDKREGGGEWGQKRKQAPSFAFSLCFAFIFHLTIDQKQPFCVLLFPYTATMVCHRHRDRDPPGDKKASSASVIAAACGGSNSSSRAT